MEFQKENEEGKRSRGGRLVRSCRDEIFCRTGRCFDVVSSFGKKRGLALR